MTWPKYTEACIDEVADMLRNHPYLTGYRASKVWGVGPKPESQVNAFEKAMATAFNVKHCIAVNSGTMAITAALVGMDLPPGSEIITTPYSFSATVTGIMLAGHIPVFADVTDYNYCLDPQSVAKAFTPKTRAIMPVDLFGGLADYEELLRFGVPVIQDNCQATGASIDRQYLFGVVACGSGNGMKNLPIGEGGWAYTNDDDVAERMRLYINHAENFDTDYIGVNGRMHELVAILGKHGLSALKWRNIQRATLANAFFRECQDTPLGFRFTANTQDDTEHVYYCTPFNYRGKRGRDWFVGECKQQGLEIGGGYITPPLYKYPAFQRFQRMPLPVADDLSYKTLCLIYNFTPDKQLSYAIETAQKVVRILQEDK